ncbi:MAG TPA: hypothetical protein VIJ66_02775 [Solirubrobacteraceae bacterium]
MSSAVASRARCAQIVLRRHIVELTDDGAQRLTDAESALAAAEDGN